MNLAYRRHLWINSSTPANGPPNTHVYELELRLWSCTRLYCAASVYPEERMSSISSQRGVESVFVSLLLCLINPVAMSHPDQSQHCRVIPGSMSLPVLEKKGDIILGGLFSVHDMVVEPNLSFTFTPPPTQCMR